MSKFNGTNNQSSYASYYNRSFYENFVFDEGFEGPIESRKFVFGEDKHYGLVDLDFNFVIPKDDVLQNHQSNDFFVKRGMPFVIDMFSDLKTILSDPQILNCTIDFDISANKSYESPAYDYERYISSVIDDYIENAILNKTTNLGKRIASNSIADYSSFVKGFETYCENFMVGQPITFTGFLASTRSSRLYSGLGIKWTSIDPSVDQPKFDEIVNSKGFRVFKQALRQVGFCFDFHDPSTIIADITSPAIFPYLKRYYITSYTDLFNRFYNKTNIININILYDILLIKYNIYTTENPYDKFITEECSRNRVGFIQRNVELNKTLDNDIETFCKLRNIEMRNPYTPKQLKSLIKKSKKLQKKFDKSTSIDYINSVFKEVLLNFSYGSKDLQRRLLTLKYQDLGGLNEPTPTSVSNY